MKNSQRFVIGRKLDDITIHFNRLEPSEIVKRLEDIFNRLKEGYDLGKFNQNPFAFEQVLVDLEAMLEFGQATPSKIDNLEEKISQSQDVLLPEEAQNVTKFQSNQRLFQIKLDTFSKALSALDVTNIEDTMEKILMIKNDYFSEEKTSQLLEAEIAEASYRLIMQMYSRGKEEGIDTFIKDLEMDSDLKVALHQKMGKILMDETCQMTAEDLIYLSSHFVGREEINLHDNTLWDTMARLDKDREQEVVVEEKKEENSSSSKEEQKKDTSPAKATVECDEEIVIRYNPREPNGVNQWDLRKARVRLKKAHKRGEDKKFRIVYSDGITTIPNLNPKEDLVEGRELIYDVSIPQSAIEIEDNAFRGFHIAKMDLSHTQIASMGRYAFADSWIEEFIAPGTLQKMGNGCFEGTSKMKKGDFSKSQLSWIWENTFRNSGIEEVLIPRTLSHIDDFAFPGTKRLKKLDLSNTEVTTIGFGAFENSGIEELIPSSKTERLGNSSFKNTPLKRLDLSQTNVKEIGNLAFEDSEIEEFIPSSILGKIGTRTFANTKHLKTLDLSNTKINVLPEELFRESDIETLKLPKFLSTILDHCFENSHLKHIDGTECRMPIKVEWYFSARKMYEDIRKKQYPCDFRSFLVRNEMTFDCNQKVTYASKAINSMGYSFHWDSFIPSREFSSNQDERIEAGKDSTLNQKETTTPNQSKEDDPRGEIE